MIFCPTGRVLLIFLYSAKAFDSVNHVQCLELVGNLGPPYQFHQILLHRYWTGSSTFLILSYNVHK